MYEHLGCDFFERRGEKRIDVGTLLTFRFFFFGWCPMFLVNFVCDFVERRGEKPSASTRVRISFGRGPSKKRVKIAHF